MKLIYQKFYDKNGEEVARRSYDRKRKSHWENELLGKWFYKLMWFEIEESGHLVAIYKADKLSTRKPRKETCKLKLKA